MHGHGSWERLGGTLDDAAGEAFDKVARILGLGMPGGPAIQQAASRGNSAAHDLPYPLRRDPKHALDFSFSGLKTDMLHRCRRAGLDPDGENNGVPPEVVNNLAAAFQSAFVAGSVPMPCSGNRHSQDSPDWGCPCAFRPWPGALTMRP